MQRRAFLTGLPIKQQADQAACRALETAKTVQLATCGAHLPSPMLPSTRSGSTTATEEACSEQVHLLCMYESSAASSRDGKCTLFCQTSPALPAHDLSIPHRAPGQPCTASTQSSPLMRCFSPEGAQNWQGLPPVPAAEACPHRWPQLQGHLSRAAALPPAEERELGRR